MADDFCTLWPEGWWSHCCKQHDADYLKQIQRVLADWDLLVCVATSGEGLLAIASPVIALVMFFGVRFFGGRYYRKAGDENAD